jgi:excisionase family DNA binding protein
VDHALPEVEDSMDSRRLTMTVEEAGVALGISRSHAYELVRQGELPSLRLGRRVVVPVASLEALVEGLPSHTDVAAAER